MKKNWLKSIKLKKQPGKGMQQQIYSIQIFIYHHHHNNNIGMHTNTLFEYVYFI